MKKSSTLFIGAAVVLAAGVFLFSSFVTQAASSSSRVLAIGGPGPSQCKTLKTVVKSRVHGDDTDDGSYPLVGGSEKLPDLKMAILQGCQISVVFEQGATSFTCLSASATDKSFNCSSVGQLSGTDADGVDNLLSPAISISEVMDNSSDVSVPTGQFVVSMRGFSPTGVPARGTAIRLFSGEQTSLFIVAKQ